MAPVNLTPSDCSRIVKDLRTCNERGYSRPKTRRKREQIIQKLRLVARQDPIPGEQTP